MPKSKSTQVERKPIKLSKLPSFDDDDDEFDLNLSNSIVDGSFLTSNSCSNSDENDEELPVGILKTHDKSKKWKPGDLAWIKYRKYCFWPCYISAITRNKLSALFICYHKFAEKERSIRYTLTSKCIKKYDSPECKQLIEHGRAFFDDAKRKKNEVEVYKNLASFNNAVELAEAYTLYRTNGEFANKKEELDFFRTNGVSLCLKKCSDDSASQLNQLSPPVDHPPSDVDKSPGDHLNITASHVENSTEDEEQSSILSPNSENLDHNSGVTSSTPLESLNSSCNHDSSMINSVSSTTRTRKRKRSNSIDVFNRKSSKLVEYILNCNCDDYLLDIFNLKIPSIRMQAYFKVWDKKSLVPKAKNLETETPYFCDENQLKSVCLYLQKFIDLNLKDIVGLVRKDELLFSVFLPETTIYGIHKVHRKPLSIAVSIYEKGYTGTVVDIDPLLATPLTKEERALVERRNEEFIRKLKASCT